MGDRVAVLKDGVLQQVDTPRALYHRPANVFVAGFIGSPAMNLFEGRLEGGRIVLPAGAIPVPDSAFEQTPALRSHDGGPLIFGIRPENLHDGARDAGSRLPTIPARVLTIEELGAELLVHVNVNAARIDSGDPDAVEELGGAANAVAKFDGTSVIKVGQTIDLAIDTAKLHYFDAETRLAL